jgi:sugar/nucleoside kinase (ribokinase family)
LVAIKTAKSRLFQNKTFVQTYLLVGHVTKDLLSDNSFITGGTVTYAAVVAKNLGWQPIIVTVAASDFRPPKYLADVDWRISPSPETLTFRNDYDSGGNRIQTIGPLAREMTPKDIPADCHQANLVHLCPLSPKLSASILDSFNNSLLVSTPQGWMRSWDAQGIVSLGDWPNATKILPKLQIAVISIEDIEGNWSIAEDWAKLVPVLVVTLGAEGCAVFYGGQRYIIPPRPSQPVDPTGAGDVFAAAFFIRYQETQDLWQSAYFANVTASIAIERPGPEGSPLRVEVEDYISQNPT